jgi:ATP-dependent Lon protease
MDRLNRILTKELEVLELGSKIQSQVQSEVGKGQREYFLREQMKAIQKELGRRRSSQGDRRTPRQDRGCGMPADGQERGVALNSTGCRRCRRPPPSTPWRGRIWTG